MTMTRRGFLAAGAGLLLSTLVRPAPRRLDLSVFCCPFSNSRYEMRSPFRQDDWVYATNSHVAARVRPRGTDVDTGSAKLPPAASLPWWNHDRLRGWQPLRPQVMLAYWACPTCDGWGFVGNLRDCPECDGENPLGCPCLNGVVGDRVCPECDSKVSRPTLGLARIGCQYFSTHEVRKFQAGECEWVASSKWSPITNGDEPLRIRGDGFDGLLMPVDTRRGEHLLVRS